MRITTQQGNIATQIGGAPPPPSQMWAGFIESNRFKVAWWPDPSYVNTKATGPGLPNTPADPNTYNYYRATGANQPFSAATKYKSGILPATNGGGEILFYYFGDGPTNNPASPPQPSTSYTVYVTATSPLQAEGAPGPPLNITTLAGGATAPTPPAPVTEPSTWIVLFALPTGTTWTCTNTSNQSVAGPVTANVGCSLSYALTHANINGGDIIVLTANATYSVLPAGLQPQAFNGTNGWTYIISSEDPVLKVGGKLPPYVDASAGANYNFPLTLLAAPAIGSTVATVLSGPAAYVDASGKWLKKTGIYPVQFLNATAGSNENEQRYVTFTNGSAAITWNNGYNPNAIDGSTGPALVTACTPKISVEYLPGVTSWDCDINGAMPIIQFGGTGTNGVGFAPNVALANVRVVGISIQPVPTNPTDNGQFLNFACWQSHGPDSHLYFDRCLFGGDDTKFTTSGWGATTEPTVTSTTFGFSAAGVGNIHCNNLLIHQCYFRGIARPRSAVGQDSNAINGFSGGPWAIQYNHIAAASEGMIVGGSFVPQATVPSDITYRYNFNTKPQWWLSAYQTLVDPSPAGPFNFTGDGTTVTFLFSLGSIGVVDSFRWGVTVAGVLQSPNTYTLTVPASPSQPFITFTTAPANGAAIAVRGTAKLIFSDYVKNNFELKTGIRVNAYGNVHWNCWWSNVSGYNGSSFSPGARDQTSSNPTTGNTIFGTCPWVQLLDVDIHDNISIGVGQGVNPFGGVDYSPTSYTARLRIRNNMFHLTSQYVAGASALGAGFVNSLNMAKIWGAEPDGFMPDFIFTNNTLIQDPTNCAIPGSTRSFYFVAGGFYDRFTIQNNILPGLAAIGGDSSFNLASTNLINPTGGGWNNNITVQDATVTGAPGGSVTYKAVPYASIGFANFIDNTHPPTQPSDWNVTVANSACNGASCTTASTTGGPVGATIGAAVPATPVFAFPSGFTGSHSVFNIVNGEGAFADPDIQVTSPFTSAHRASAVWYRTQVNVQSFTTQFTIQLPSTAIFAAAPTGPYTPPCEGGMVFCIQNSNTTTNPGANGAGITVNADTNLCGLGGFYNPLLNTFQYPVGNSIAIKFDQNNENNQSSLYPGGGVPNSFGLYVNGGPCAAMCPQDDLNPSGINFYNGNILAVTIVYDGTLLTMTLLDTVTNAQLRHSWPINIPQAMGGNSGWPGFGAGTIPPVAYTLKTWSWWQGFNTRLATPTFNVASGSYTTTQTVTISGPAGAAIYYTTNGQAPTTSSTLYTGPLTVSATTVLQAIAVQSSFTDSLVASADYQIQAAGLPHINFPNFTSQTNLMSCVGTAAVSGAALWINRTTDPGGGGGAAWYPVPVNIGTFSTSFTFTPSSSGGFTFCIQNQPPANDFTNNNSPPPAATSQALWDAGPGDPILRWSCGGPLAIANSSRGGLGYTGYPSTGSVCYPLSGFTRAIAVKFQASGGNGSNTGLYQGLVNIAANSVDMSGSNVHLNNGHSFTASLSYNGTTLTLSVTDTTTLAVFSTSFTVNIPNVVGGSTAYVGFTGAGGGANQNIMAWTYTDHFP